MKDNVPITATADFSPEEMDLALKMLENRDSSAPAGTAAGAVAQLLAKTANGKYLNWRNSYIGSFDLLAEATFAADGCWVTEDGTDIPPGFLDRNMTLTGYFSVQLRHALEAFQQTGPTVDQREVADPVECFYRNAERAQQAALVLVAQIGTIKACMLQAGAKVPCDLEDYGGAGLHPRVAVSFEHLRYLINVMHAVIKQGEYLERKLRT